ncbi:MAG: putative metal-binding motif-containing protein, partial [bacterium]
MVCAGDCDDTDPDRYPGNAEICDGKDNDCNDVIPPDETEDLDGDGWVACKECDDNDNERYPGNTEICDGKDNDCNGIIPSDETADLDSDGSVTCKDCDDNDADRYPGNTETCDNKDNDCNGIIDDPDVLEYTLFFFDADNDFYGDPNTSVNACAQPAGYTEDSTDCNDKNKNINPVSTEICNGTDDDCDGLIDIDDWNCQDGCVIDLGIKDEYSEPGYPNWFSIP